MVIYIESTSRNCIKQFAQIKTPREGYMSSGGINNNNPINTNTSASNSNFKLDGDNESAGLRNRELLFNFAYKLKTDSRLQDIQAKFASGQAVHIDDLKDDQGRSRVDINNDGSFDSEDLMMIAKIFAAAGEEGANHLTRQDIDAFKNNDGQAGRRNGDGRFNDVGPQQQLFYDTLNAMIFGGQIASGSIFDPSNNAINQAAFNSMMTQIEAEQSGTTVLYRDGYYNPPMNSDDQYLAYVNNQPMVDQFGNTKPQTRILTEYAGKGGFGNGITVLTLEINGHKIKIDIEQNQITVGESEPIDTRDTAGIRRALSELGMEPPPEANVHHSWGGKWVWNQGHLNLKFTNPDTGEIVNISMTGNVEGMDTFFDFNRRINFSIEYPNDFDGNDLGGHLIDQRQDPEDFNVSENPSLLTGGDTFSDLDDADTIAGIEAQRDANLVAQEAEKMQELAAITVRVQSAITAENSGDLISLLSELDDFGSMAGSLQSDILAALLNIEARLLAEENRTEQEIKDLQEAARQGDSAARAILDTMQELDNVVGAIAESETSRTDQLDTAKEAFGLSFDLNQTLDLAGAKIDEYTMGKELNAAERLLGDPNADADEVRFNGLLDFWNGQQDFSNEIKNSITGTTFENKTAERDLFINMSIDQNLLSQQIDHLLSGTNTTGTFDHNGKTLDVDQARMMLYNTNLAMLSVVNGGSVSQADNILTGQNAALRSLQSSEMTLRGINNSMDLPNGVKAAIEAHGLDATADKAIIDFPDTFKEHMDKIRDVQIALARLSDLDPAKANVMAQFADTIGNLLGAVHDELQSPATGELNKTNIKDQLDMVTQLGLRLTNMVRAEGGTLGVQPAGSTGGAGGAGGTGGTGDPNEQPTIPFNAGNFNRLLSNANTAFANGTSNDLISAFGTGDLTTQRAAAESILRDQGIAVNTENINSMTMIGKILSRDLVVVSRRGNSNTGTSSFISRIERNIQFNMSFAESVAEAVSNALDSIDGAITYAERYQFATRNMTLDDNQYLDPQALTGLATNLTNTATQLGIALT